jgi:very-short-patch-repair endonuclease
MDQGVTAAREQPMYVLASRQHGLLAKAQLLRVWSARQINTRVTQGLLIPLRPNVYRLATAPRSWQQELLAVCFSYGHPTVASHRSGGSLWWLDGVPSQRIEVTVPHHRSGRMPGVVTHRAAMPDTDMTWRFSIPVTKPERTLIDLSSVVGSDTLERALDEALRHGHTTIAKLQQRLQATRQGGGRRLRILRQLVAERGPGFRPGDTQWEDRLYGWIVKGGLPAPKRQHWVVVNGERRCLDLAYPEPKIVIEYDGWDTHRLRRHFDDDRVRTADLQLAGWLVLAFTSRSTEPEVVSKVGKALAQRAGTRSVE